MTLDKRLMAAASVIAVILFLTVNIGSSVLNSNTQLAFDTKKHNSGTADFNGMRSFSSLSKSINYTYEVKSPTSVLNSLNIIAAHRGVTRMKGVDAVLVSNGNSFSLFTRNVTIKSEPNLNPGVLYDLFYYFHSEIIKLEITGGNGYNYTFTNDTGAPIAMFTYPAVDLENATISLLATGHIFRTYLNTPTLPTTNLSVDPISCPGCPPDTMEYKNTVTFKTTTTNLFDIPITIIIVYSPSGIISGSIEVESDYSITYFSPLISITEKLTDSLGFNWQIGLPITTTSSTNTHSYTHQDTTISFKITFEYRSPLYYNGQYYYYYDLYYTAGTSITVPMLT